MEWETPFKDFEAEVIACLRLFNSFSLGLIESEFAVSAKENHKNSTDRHFHGIISQPILSDIAAIQDVSSFSPEYDITKVLNKPCLKYHAKTMNEFLDQYPLRTNAREVENQSHSENSISIFVGPRLPQNGSNCISRLC